MTFTKRLQSAWLITAAVVFTFLLLPVHVFALSAEQKAIYDKQVHLYDNEVYQCGDASVGSTPGDGTAVGGNNPEKAFNFFVAKGLSGPQAAGIVGNMQVEAYPEIGTNYAEGTRKPHPDPSDLTTTSQGWGIVGWTPGANAITYAKTLNLTGDINELGVQLEMVWQAMSGKLKGVWPNLVPAYKQQTDPAAAAKWFMDNFERPNAAYAHLDQRQQFAVDALKNYGANAPTAPTDTGDDASASAPVNCDSDTVVVGTGISPDCTNAQGNAKILCQAKKYDPVSYQEVFLAGHQGGAAWHKTCPTIGPSCILDCSGLVNIAVYDVYGADLRETTYSEIQNIGKNWKKISFSEVQAGDILQPNTGHVEIIDHVEGSQIITFGAHTSKYPQPRQVGPSSYSILPNNVYLRYIGPGSTVGA